MVRRRIVKKSKVWMLFGLCWVVYFSSYLGRLNFSGVMSQMMAENLMDKSQAGLVNTVFFVTYAAGQLINGVLGDRCSPRWMLFIGCMGAGICNLMGGVTQNFGVILLLRALDGYFMAMLWPPVLRIFAEMLTPRDMVRCSIHMTSAVAAGTLGAYLLSAAMLEWFGWRAAFYAPGLWLMLISVVWVVGFGYLQTYCQREGVEEEEEQTELASQSGQPRLAFWTMMTIPGVLMMLVPVVMHGVLKDGVTSWVPAYITENFHTDPAFSVLVTTLLPVVNLTGAVAAQFVYNKISRNEFTASALFFTLAIAALSALLLWGQNSLVLTLILFALITSSTLAINTLLVSILPLRFERYGRSSSLSGALNAVAYAGSAAAAAAIGFLSQRFGWGATIFSWLAITVVALIFCLAGTKSRLDVKQNQAGSL